MPTLISECVSLIVLSCLDETSIDWVGTNAVRNRAETTAVFLFFFLCLTFSFYAFTSALHSFPSVFVRVFLLQSLLFTFFSSSRNFSVVYIFSSFFSSLFSFFLYFIYAFLTLCHSFILCFFYILPNFATFQKSEFRFSKICGCVFKILLPDVSNEDTFFIFKSKDTAFLQKTSGTINTDSSPTRTESWTKPLQKPHIFKLISSFLEFRKRLIVIHCGWHKETDIIKINKPRLQSRIYIIAVEIQSLRNLENEQINFKNVDRIEACKN